MRGQHGRVYKRIKKIISPRVFKILTMLAAVILQAAVIVIPYVFFLHPIVGHLRWVFVLLSIFIIFYLLRSEINPVYKIPWIIILLVIPVFGVVIYVLYGRVHFGKKEVQRAKNTAEAFCEAIKAGPSYNRQLRQENEYIAVQADYLLRNADAVAYKNTRAWYYPLGDDMFPVMLREFEKAEKYIFMEYFIIEEGKMFNAIIRILKEKAKAGVEVRVMYDSIGSLFKSKSEVLNDMIEAGIKVLEFNEFRSIYDSRINNRDHRKICVIDGETGFTGGINLADEYINQKTVFGHWKDTGIMLKGEAVWSLTAMFLTLWNNTNRKADDLLKYMSNKKFSYDDGYYIPYTDYPLDSENVGKNVYLNMIERANKYVYIMTPYLIPDNILICALENAAKNGVDVKIITPGIPDKKIVFMLTQSYYEILIKAGVKIYEYTPGFIHAKVFLSDDETAVVGSINLDYRSLLHHFENAVWIYKSGIIKKIKQDFADTIGKSKKISYDESRKQTLLKRILLPILRLFSPLM